MHRPQPGTAARGLVAGSVCGAGALLAHAFSAEGRVDAATAPTALAVVAAGLVLGPLLTRPGRLPLGRTAVVTVGLQLLAHLSMALTAATHHHGRAHVSALDHAVSTVLAGGTTMLLAHLGAAVLTTLLARRADTAVLSLLADWLFPPLPVAPGTVPAHRPPPPPVVVVVPAEHARTRPAGPRAPPGPTASPALHA